MSPTVEDEDPGSIKTVPVQPSKIVENPSKLEAQGAIEPVLADFGNN